MSNSHELPEYRDLVDQIEGGNCVLVLGPRVAVRPADPQRRPLDERAAAEVLTKVTNVSDPEKAAAATNLRRASDLHYQQHKAPASLQRIVRTFYESVQDTTDFHKDLARLPFRLCVSASPDDLMYRAFEDAGKTPARSHYSFRDARANVLSAPTAASPLVYHLFGHYQDQRSLVLMEDDLVRFLVAIVKGTPPVPDQVRSMLADPEASFLFLGFGFHNWYLRVLLQVLDVYGHQSKAIAFEDEEFFNHPDRLQTVGFFSGDRRIDFLPLQWEGFARSLRAVYEEGKGTVLPARKPAEDAPKAFLSYASEDRVRVEQLAEQLRARGVNVFQDKRGLRAGDQWNTTLLDYIEQSADYVIVVQTEAMASRVEGVFHREIDAALQRQGDFGEGADGRPLRFLIPIRIGNGPILGALRDFHVIDVNDADGFNQLVQSIEEDWERRVAKRRAIA